MDTESEHRPNEEGLMPSRRTQFAQERTLLAWWRTGIAATAVALAMGSLVPRLGHYPKARFLALGCGYGVLALGFVIGGTIRERLSRKALMNGSFSTVPSWIITVIATYFSILVVLTVVAFF